MFVGFYKFVNADEADASVVCVLGRSALTVASHPVTIINQVLVHDENGNHNVESARLLAMCQAQNIFTLDGAIDPDILDFSRAMIGQLREYKISNPTHKLTLKISVERYKSDHMFYLDWENRWASIQETDPNMIGKTYLKYVIKKNGTRSIEYGAFEVIPYDEGG